MRQVMQVEDIEGIYFWARGYRTGRKESLTAARQHPAELQDLINLFLEKRVRSYAEIGCADGGTFHVVASILSQASGSTFFALDCTPEPKLLKRHWPDCYHCQDAFDWSPSDRFDAILIDLNCSYEATRKIVTRAAKSSDIIAVHDVCDRRWGQKRFWRDYGKSENLIHHGRGPGIGIIYSQEL